MTNEPFSIDILPKAAKDLKGLRPYTKQALDEIAVLRKNPHAGPAKQGSLRGARSLEFSLPGRGRYRALYVVLTDERVCLIFLVGPHEGIYARAERRYKALRKLGAIP
jgi:mRNA-degrading endonuclease RelE of RelBE toxin-antitoxin system